MTECLHSNPQDVCWHTYCNSCDSQDVRQQPPQRSLLPAIFILLVAALTTVGCDAARDMLNATSNKQMAFSKILTGVNGTTRSNVMALMGDPQSAESSNLLGLDGEIVTFSDYSTTYKIVLINHHAVAKQSSSNSTK